MLRPDTGSTIDGEPPLEICNALWIGESLPDYSAACLNSFVEVGHRVRLHVYDLPANVPATVEIVDANQFVAREHIIRHHKSGSLAVFADRYRYELLAARQGLWIDSDVLCVRPIVQSDGYLFGRENGQRINNAILKLPSGSPILENLRSIFTTPRWSPPWSDWKRRLRDRIAYASRKDYGVAHMSWGTTGPRALTYHAKEHGVAHFAAEPEVFYPVSVPQAHRLLEPNFRIETVVTPNTLCIHLWADVINKLMKDGVPAGSFIDDVIAGRWRERVAVAPSGETDHPRDAIAAEP